MYFKCLHHGVHLRGEPQFSWNEPFFWDIDLSEMHCPAMSPEPTITNPNFQLRHVLWEAENERCQNSWEFSVVERIVMEENEPKPNTKVDKSAEAYGRDGLVSGLSWAKNRVYEINQEKGWFDEDRTFGDDIALLHSEVSEMLEEYRDQYLYRYVRHDDGTHKGVVERLLDGEPYPPGMKPLGVPSEAADVLVRLLDLCHRWGIDLAKEFIIKTEYNATRPHRHGGKRL